MHSPMHAPFSILEIVLFCFVITQQPFEPCPCDWVRKGVMTVKWPGFPNWKWNWPIGRIGLRSFAASLGSCRMTKEMIVDLQYWDTNLVCWIHCCHDSISYYINFIINSWLHEILLKCLLVEVLEDPRLRGQVLGRGSREKQLCRAFDFAGVAVCKRKAILTEFGGKQMVQWWREL